MDEQTAKLVIAAGLAAGLLFWLASLNLYRKMASAETRRRFETQLPNRAPADALSDLIAQGNVISAQARVSRPSPTQLKISQMGINVDIETVRFGNGTKLIADCDDSAMTRWFLRGFATLVLLIAPLVIVAVGIGLWNYVALSPTPAVRWQSLQVLQICHVLWPPFLVYFLWKKFHTLAGNAVSNLLVFAGAKQSPLSP